MSLFVLFFFSQVNAEDELVSGEVGRTSHFDATLELTTKYMWRGIEYGTAPVTYASINYSNGGLNAYALGGYAIDGSQFLKKKIVANII